MTLAVVKGTGQVFCSMSLIFGYRTLSHDWSGSRVGEQSTEVWYPCHLHLGGGAHDGHVISDVNLGHLVEAGSSLTLQIGKQRLERLSCLC